MAESSFSISIKENIMDYIEFFKNDRFATEAGITLSEVRPGYAKAKLKINEHHLNAGNVVQGGQLPPPPTLTAVWLSLYSQTFDFLKAPRSEKP